MTPPPALASHQHTLPRAGDCAAFFYQRVRVRRRRDCTSGAPPATKAATSFQCQHVRKNAGRVQAQRLQSVTEGGGGTESSNASALLIEDSAHVNTQTSGQEKNKPRCKKKNKKQKKSPADPEARAPTVTLNKHRS